MTDDDGVHYNHSNNIHNIFDYFYNRSHTMDSSTCRDPACIFLATVQVIVFILGSAGNAVVIWITGFKMKKSISSTWYLSLAVSNFLFCCTLPLTVVHRVREDWIFGVFLCKFIPFIEFLTMFSNIFTLVIITVDQCMLVMFPVWAQNQRTIRKASVIVTLVWIISAVLSTPSLIFYNVHTYYSEQFCYSFQDLTAVVAYLFVFECLIPFLIIIVCYNIIMKLDQSVRFKKPFKIMTALTVTFFICLLPFHIHAFMELNYILNDERPIIDTYVLGVTLAYANSCLNPFIYAFMGRDIKIKWYMFLSKIENALVEKDEDQTTQQWLTLTEENI